MKTLSHNFLLRPFNLLIAAAFCLVGCSSPAPETSTPQPKDAGVVEMQIQKSDDNKSSMEEAPKTAPAAGSGSSAEEADGGSGPALTPPNS